MAYLHNTKYDTFIELQLKNNKENNFWLKYILNLGIKQNYKYVTVLSLNNSQLYLDAFLEPEVPKICKGLLSVINKNTNKFIFEPIDEKDFRLEFKNNKDKYIIEIFSDQFNINNSIDWIFESKIGLKMEVTKEEILKFISSLQSEYDNIVTRCQ
ncbi:hypothetical protein [Defluviitalea phaphyphila]|uniref:hypothetical protein n=1 Tax=Defluviitalea phaphyphila TaxID=1473580 RepID=UPI00073035A2|nr:hypothetical protein [Defluviitalea phaphyphila]